MKMLDTLKSLVSGLGTAKDKTTSLQYGFRFLDDNTLNAMHRTDWLARKIVDIIPNDMTREWRDWSATAEQIQAIEAVEKAPAINLQVKINHALQKARLFGGAVIYMGMKDKTPELPLDVERVQKGDLLYLHVLTRREITAGEISYDVTSEFYGKPAWYELAATAGSMIRVHPSRIVRFVGAEILDTRFNTNFGWGDSVLQIVYDAVINASSVQAHVASMVPEAKTDVIYIPGLSEVLRSPATTKQLTDRFTYANTMKSMFNMILLEGDGTQGEKWEQKQIRFATLPEIVAQFLQIAAGAADIPVTRLVGEAPKGFQATGDSNIRDYYDNVSARQKTELAPALHRLDEVVIRSALGSRDPQIYYAWAPLWSMSEKEKADIFNTKATAARSLVGTGGASPQIIPIDALSEALVNAFVEDGSLPGLDAAIAEFGSLAEQEAVDPAAAEAAVVPANGNQPAGKTGAADSAPKTLYVRRDVVNAAEIKAWAKKQGIKDIVPDLHVTLIYSRTPVAWIKAGNASDWGGEKDGHITIAPGGPRVVEPLGNMAAVLMFASSQLCWRHEEIVRAGASHDFEDYQPHISLTKAQTDLSKIEPYRGKIVLGPEVFEEVKQDDVTS